MVVMWAMTLPVIFTALYAWPDGAFAVVVLWFGLVVFVGIKCAVRALGVSDGSRPGSSARIHGRRVV